MKKIYLLTQGVDIGDNTYDSMVIIADSKEEAILLSYERVDMLSKEINQDFVIDYIKLDKPFKGYIYLDIVDWNGWALEQDITVHELGTVNTEWALSRVVCSSYNAG